MKYSAAPNNGMHPTGMRLDAIRKFGCLNRYFPAGDAERYAALVRMERWASARGTGMGSGAP